MNTPRNWCSSPKMKTARVEHEHPKELVEFTKEENYEKEPEGFEDESGIMQRRGMNPRLG